VTKSTHNGEGKEGGSGGGDEVKTVINIPGSIGYANLNDARASTKGTSNYTWVEVQNNGVATHATYANPSTNGVSTKSASSNCENTVYPALPSSKVSSNWSEIYGGHPTAEKYPICTLTWDIALKNYKGAEYGAKAHEEGQTAHDYMKFLVASEAGGGQELALKDAHDYIELPSNVLAWSQGVIKLIN
jgi:hypothetical protein